MNVTALIGESGSGKSYKAIILAKELEIEYIIDDGLLIKGNKVIAGKSAKAEKTRISAVKRAIFLDNEHRNSIRESIERFDIKDILIIGTSENMIEKITNALEFDEVYQKIYITDISTQEEIKLAKHSRTIEGKHIIPVPTFEVKKDFSGYFIDSLRIFKKKDKRDSYEKTIMRPTFSYLGNYSISNDVIKDIIMFNISKFERVYRVRKIDIENFDEGICINIDITMFISYGILDIVKSMQRKVKVEIEHMTSLNILSVNVYIKGLKLKKGDVANEILCRRSS